MSDNKPEPGSPEYDLMMAAKFRSQRNGGDSLSISYREVEGSGGKVQVHTNSLVNGPEPSINADASDPGQFLMIERDIARLRAELEETIEELDPVTGKAQYRFVGRERTNRECQLDQLENHTLPYQRQLQQMALEAQANQPNTEDNLRAELERKQAIKARGEQIADEEEAVQEAVRVIEARRNAGGLK